MGGVLSCQGLSTKCCHGPWHPWHNQGGANPLPNPQLPRVPLPPNLPSITVQMGASFPIPGGSELSPHSSVLLQLVTAIKLITLLGLCSESACSKAGSVPGAEAWEICALGLYMSSEGEARTESCSSTVRTISEPACGEAESAETGLWPPWGTLSRRMPNGTP